MTMLIGLVAIVSNPVAVVFYFLFLNAGRFVRYFADIFGKNKPASRLLPPSPASRPDRSPVLGSVLKTVTHWCDLHPVEMKPGKDAVLGEMESNEKPQEPAGSAEFVSTRQGWGCSLSQRIQGRPSARLTRNNLLLPVTGHAMYIPRLMEMAQEKGVA
jgi:hypothetical protein